MNAVWVAAIVGLGTLAQIYMSGRVRRADKREDWAREDAVAARVEEARTQAATAARLLLERQDAIAAQAREAAALLLANNEAVAATAAETQGQLQVIHTLVNSTLTGAKQAQLEATLGQLVLLNQFTPGDTGAIAAAQTAVEELRVELADRIEQTRVADTITAQAPGQLSAPDTHPQEDP